jgi:prophage regulatory protein
MQAHQFLRREQVIAKLGISKTTLYNLEKAGKFPHHFMVTPRCAVWHADEVDAWMQQRAGVATSAAVPSRNTQAKRAAA